ncbi:hypothetical protein BCR43DRAFT_223500 [Syncephalastrum racemosum]|uniref:Uncharacterized protein n=1 Tax=Syncephalastrum racemosum TaxID=13706 RepID=A0A1X2HJI5_SYNRA|nr:hypothetical protein BCR43DRAFT_223500 [Syncephalastrum racemosum]
MRGALRCRYCVTNWVLCRMAKRGCRETGMTTYESTISSDKAYDALAGSIDVRASNAVRIDRPTTRCLVSPFLLDDVLTITTSSCAIIFKITSLDRTTAAETVVVVEAGTVMTWGCRVKIVIIVFVVVVVVRGRIRGIKRGCLSLWWCCSCSGGSWGSVGGGGHALATKVTAPFGPRALLQWHGRRCSRSRRRRSRRWRVIQERRGRIIMK